MSLATLFLVIALICFILAAIGVAVSRVNLIAAGLAFVVAAALFGAHAVT